jgi:hypothetical protein
MRMRFSSSSITEFGKLPISWRKGLVSHRDDSARKEIAVSSNAALAFLEAKPKNSRVFD